MQTIELKTIPMKVGEKVISLSYKQQLIEIIRNPGAEKGLDLEAVRRSIRVLDVLDNAQDTLALEDADFEYMKARVLEARWPVVDKAITQFVDDVTGAKQ